MIRNDKKWKERVEELRQQRLNARRQPRKKNTDTDTMMINIIGGLAIFILLCQIVSGFVTGVPTDKHPDLQIPRTLLFLG